jgi:hypothetical protein
LLHAARIKLKLRIDTPPQIIIFDCIFHLE